MQATVTRIRMNNEAISYLVNPKREDLTAPKLAKMKDHDVEILCKNLCWVEITAVAAVAADPAAAPPVAAVAAVAAHRIYITQLAEDCLKTACFIARHLVCCQCQPMAASITLQRLDDWTIQQDEEKNHTEPVEHPELLKSDAISIVTFLEDFPNALFHFNGASGRPLAYVLHEAIAPPADPDPIFGANGSIYTSIQDEIIGRALIDRTNPAYVADNARVHNLLTNAISNFPDLKVWTKEFDRSKNGRGAWEALKGRYQGESYHTMAAATADRVLISNWYTGEKQGYNFDKHVAKHKESHIILSQYSTEPNGRDKVRHLLDSIEAPGLANAVLTIKTDQTGLQDDFDASVDYLKQQVSSSYPVQSTRVASTGTTKRKTPEFIHYSAGNKAKVMWYSRDEFLNLSKELRDQLQALNLQRPRKLCSATTPPSFSDSSTTSRNKKRNDRRKQCIAALKAELATTARQQASSTSTSNLPTTGGSGSSE